MAVSQGAGHHGPKYTIPSGADMDTNSSTTDSARGGHKVSWVDAFNMEHRVDVSNRTQVRI